jgi:hypothetical protein
MGTIGGFYCVEKDSGEAGNDPPQDDIFAERRAALARQYASLPAYGSAHFWSPLEECRSEQHFWEESFHHALRFARKHTYESFLRREGHWQKVTPGPGFRVPQRLLESLERAEWQTQLGISDRTVRNRLRAALAQLRRIVVEDQEVIDGASA